MLLTHQDANRQERVEDLALALRNWAHVNQVRFGQAIEEIAAAILVANQGNAPVNLAEELSKQLIRLSHRPSTPEQAWLSKMTRNVNDILRGRA